MHVVFSYVRFGTSLLHIRKTIPMCDLERPFCTSGEALSHEGSVLEYEHQAPVAQWIEHWSPKPGV